jgi:DNA-binding XRE family transcriptional regulator
MTEQNEMKLRGMIHAKFRNIKDFFNSIGRSRQIYYDLKDGKYNPKDELVIAIAEALGEKESKIRKLFS